MIGFEKVANGLPGTKDRILKFLSTLTENELKELYMYMERVRVSDSTYFDDVVLQRYDIAMEMILDAICSKSTAGVILSPLKENNTVKSLPNCLSERGIEAFKTSVEHGLIDKESYRWNKKKSALACWVRDLCAVGGVTTKLAFGCENDWKSFEEYFGHKDLAQAYNSSDQNKSCPDYFDVRAKIFPDLPPSKQ